MMRLSMRMQSTVPPPQRSNVNVKKWGLLVLGALAVGTTIYSVSNEKGEPKEFLEAEKRAGKQEKQAGPAFSEDQVSVIFVLGGPGAGKVTSLSTYPLVICFVLSKTVKGLNSVS